MSGTPTKATAPVVHSILVASGKEGAVKRDICRRLSVDSRAVTDALGKLCATGAVTVQRRGRFDYYVDHATLMKSEGPIVPPPYVNRWTKPLQGYDARMQAAMRMRSV